MNTMIGSILRRRPRVAVDDADVQPQTTPDPELKLPKTSSLVIIITSNLLLQVTHRLLYQKSIYIVPKYPTDIILYHCFLFKCVYRAPRGNISVVWSHPWYSNRFCGFGLTTHDEIRRRQVLVYLCMFPVLYSPEKYKLSIHVSCAAVCLLPPLP